MHVHCFLVEFGHVSFCGGGAGGFRKKKLAAGMRINNKFNTQIAQRIEPTSHW